MMIGDYFVDDSMNFLSKVKDYDFTKESQITDREPVLTAEEIDVLKRITLNDMMLSEPYESGQNGPNNMNVFDVFSKHDETSRVVLSNREPSCGELRGWFLRKLLKQAKEENSEQTVFDAIQSKVTTLEYNVLAIMSLRFFLDIEKVIARQIFSHHKNNAYNNDAEIRQALEEAVSVISKLMKALELFSLSLNDNKDVLTKSTKEIFYNIKHSLQAFSSGKLTLADLKESCLTMGNTINQLEINKYQGYTGIKKVLSMIAFLLLSVLSLGVANVVSYQSKGSFVFFQGDQSKFEEKQTVAEIGSLLSFDASRSHPSP